MTKEINFGKYTIIVTLNKEHADKVINFRDYCETQFKLMMDPNIPAMLKKMPPWVPPLKL